MDRLPRRTTSRRRGSSSPASSRALAVDGFIQGQIDDAALDLRDCLLCHDDDVRRVQPASPPDRIGEKLTEIVAALELGDSAERDDADLVVQSMPVTLLPARPR